MLFNSVEFVFVFMPCLLVVFFWLARHSQLWAAAWLTAGSLAFYAWWNPVYVGLLLVSIIFNYTVGRALAHGSDVGSKRRSRLLAFGVTGDLLLLGYYKYSNFFVDTVNAVTGSGYHLAPIILPLGISFFTFTQIAFLVDAARGQAKEFNPIHYGLFVTYFPHLIAGPVLHHKQMMPQFGQASTYRFSHTFMVVGLSYFALGLFKKVVLADSVAVYVGDPFAAAARGEALGLLQAWGGALAYSLQLYFDFSGYCDMAIGLSYMIGVRLPINFNSPYKAANIADFWRRWHMTLSSFLRDYLYIPLGGNRHGPPRRYVNLMLTMLLGGLWHGAGWTFVIWGGLHGAYLVLHQAWQALRQRMGHNPARSSRGGRALAMAMTFLAVLVGWVFFRATSWSAAVSMLVSMAGVHGVSLPDALLLRLGGLGSWLVQQGVEPTLGGGRMFVFTYLWILLLLPVVFLAPNTQQIMGRFEPALRGADRSDAGRASWRADWRWATVMAIVLGCGLLSLTRPSEFLYFQF